MKKFFFLAVAACIVIATFTACSKQGVTIKTQQLPLSAAVTQQLDKSRQNWNQYASGLAELQSFGAQKRINSEEERAAILQEIVTGSAYIAYGNVLDASTLQLTTAGAISQQSKAAIDTLAKYAAAQIKTGDVVMDIHWKKDNLSFVSKCVVNDETIVWDNLLTNVIMMNTEPTVVIDSLTGSQPNASYRQWYKSSRTWTANWIFGARRGEMGEEITVWPYSNGQVYNTDNRDWGYMNIGSATSQSKVTVNTGTYGKIQYALGLATPAAWVSFNGSTFKAEVHGLGSNMIQNGSHTLTPYPL
jgi:hypothetical protein